MMKEKKQHKLITYNKYMSVTGILTLESPITYSLLLDSSLS